MFASAGHDAEHNLGNSSLVILGLFANLRKASRIDVQCFHIDQYLVRSNLHTVVKTCGSLRKGAGGLQHSMGAKWTY